MSKEIRSRLVKETSTRLKGQQHAIVVNYRGIKGLQVAELRDTLRKDKIRMTVVKNATATIAFKEIGLEGLNAHLSGQTAIIYGADDPAVLSRSLFTWVEKNKILEIKGGVVDGKPVTTAELKVIASLPPKPVMLAMLLGVMQAPVRGLAVALHEVPGKLARSLKSVADQKGVA